MLETIIKRKRKKIEELAEKGLLPADVCTAIGLTPAQFAQINADDEHPFNTIYWAGKTKHIDRVRTAAIDIIENGTDESVKFKLIEYLTQEHNTALENKRLTVGYTNIKKLVSLIRKHKDEKIVRNTDPIDGPLMFAAKQHHTKKTKEIFDGKLE